MIPSALQGLPSEFEKNPRRGNDKIYLSEVDKNKIVISSVTGGLLTSTLVPAAF